MDIFVNSIKIHYEVLGKGKSIILLNPNSVNTRVMKFIANRLKDKYKVYIFDRRCCGKSEKNCELTYEESAKDVYEFIKKLNISKPVFYGFSDGGIVGLLIAIKEPKLLSKIIISGANLNPKGMKKSMLLVSKIGYFFTKNKFLKMKGRKNYEKKSKWCNTNCISCYNYSYVNISRSNNVNANRK